MKTERMSDFRFAALTRWFSVEEIPTYIHNFKEDPTDDEIFNALKAEREAVEAAEAKLEAMRGLIPGWKEGDFNLPAYALGKRDGRHECADELEALLNKEQTK